jgi:hypothetical protein
VSPYYLPAEVITRFGVSACQFLIEADFGTPDSREHLFKRLDLSMMFGR